VDNLYLALKKFGHRVSCIHGDKKQQQRQEAIKRFSMGQISILIATDIASRGLDFPKVTHVINFDLPTNIEDYIHRIGRTGRCGNTGIAISFVNEYNKPIIRNLYYFMKKNHQKINDWFENLNRNCKDISVNIFDRIPKRPKRSLGAHSADKYSSGRSNYPSNYGSSGNAFNSSYNAYSSSNNNNFNSSSSFNNQPTNNSFPSQSSSSGNFNSNNNNFAQPMSASSSYERSDKYAKYDSTRRDSSASRYPVNSSSYNSSGASALDKKFSGSTTYNPSSQEPYSKESGAESSKYPSSSYSRGASDYHSSSSSRNSNQMFLGKKHPYPSSSGSAEDKDNEESSYQRNRRSRFDYDSSSGGISGASKPENAINTSANNTSDYNRNKDRRESSYKDDRVSSSSNRDYKDNRYGSSGYRGSDRGDSGRSSNFHAPATNFRSNFSSSSSNNNNFSSYPNASNAYNNSNVKDSGSASLAANSSDLKAIGSKSSGFAASQGASALNMMYPQISPGVPMNYNMYPGMNYANYYAQQNNSNNNSKSITKNNPQENNSNPENINKANPPLLNNNNNTISHQTTSNPAEVKNTNSNNTNSSSNPAAVTASSNPYSAYYNYASAYSAYGYGTNFSGYDPYNGQVYDAYKQYNYAYPGAESSNPNANINAENKSNQEKK